MRAGDLREMKKMRDERRKEELVSKRDDDSGSFDTNEGNFDQSGCFEERQRAPQSPPLKRTRLSLRWNELLSLYLLLMVGWTLCVAVASSDKASVGVLASRPLIFYCRRSFSACCTGELALREEEAGGERVCDLSKRKKAKLGA